MTRTPNRSMSRPINPLLYLCVWVILLVPATGRQAPRQVTSVLTAEGVNISQPKKLALWSGHRMHSASTASRLGPCSGFDCVKQYVDLNDSAFRWSDTQRRLRGTVELSGGGIKRSVAWTGYVLNMTSQTWLTPADSSRYVWWHPMVIVVPESVSPGGTDWATMVIGGAGRANEEFHDPDRINEKVEDVAAAIQFATRTSAVAVALLQVPNQPIIFSHDSTQKVRFEDAIKAYTWRRLIDEPDRPEWPVEMPNVKAAVRAMDVAAAFTSRVLPNGPVRRFAVSGCSKRGMASWMTAAVDERVRATLPCVIALNQKTIIHNVIKSMGNPSYALFDYRDSAIIRYVDSHPQSDRLFGIVDPYTYLDKLTVPKFVMNTGSDEFFMPDSSREYYDDLEEPKQQLVLPNLPHQGWLTPSNFIPAASAFINGVMLGHAKPTINYNIDTGTGAITVTQASDHSPTKVSLLVSRTCDGHRRDFRWANFDTGKACLRCGVSNLLAGSPKCFNTMVHWDEHLLRETLPGSRTWVADVQPPGDGRWAAFFISFRYNSVTPGVDDWEMSTTVSVVPNTYPFPECNGADCMGTKLVLISGDATVS